jgi:signal transduction histidine kinase
MVSASEPRLRRPSAWWLVLAVLAIGFAVAAGATALIVQRNATRPIGEGVVFVSDADRADQIIEGAPDLDVGVRMARNDLDVEAVSLVDREGLVVSSTSDPLVGEPLASELLRSAVENGRFSALASPIGQDIWLDGVLAWPAGTVLYQVVAPSDDGRHSLLIHYDVSSLLSRRTPPGSLQPETLELLAVSVVFVLFAILILFGRGRAARRYRRLAIESEVLRKHSAELEASNRALEAARNSAVQALALAEEKIRIRAEFVLMINHELRTPLTSVVTGADLLRTTEMSGKERDSLLESMIHDGKRLVEIVDQILAVARIENKGVSSELVDVPFEKLCDVHSEVTTPPPSQCHGLGGWTVKTDPTALKLVLESLVDNARTHGAESVSVVCSTEPRVEAGVEVGSRPDQAVFLSVIDDGPGIDPDFLPRVFEKFEKSGFSSGTGLGLYMVWMVVESMMGSVAVESSGSGTTFQIALPASPVRATAGTPK